MKPVVRPIPLPTAGEIGAIDTLYALCNRHDSTAYLYDAPDQPAEGTVDTFVVYDADQLVASLSIFAPRPDEAEIVALTHPALRRRGCFSLLLTEAERELRRRDVESILFVCDARSADGLGMLAESGAAYEYSEYLMRCRADGSSGPGPAEDGVELYPAAPEDRDELVRINREAFGYPEKEAASVLDLFFRSRRRRLFAVRYYGRLVGMIGIYLEAERDYIHGFCIDRAYRGRGIGRSALKLAVGAAGFPGNGRTLELEVAADNAGALGLYSSAGFEEVAEFRYYRRTL